MLDEKRIKEAEANVKSYLAEELLKKTVFDKVVFNVLLRNAKESLETAGFLAKSEKSDLWVIVSSYYSMYYISNAVLYKLGFKVGEKISHKVTADSLIVHVRDRLKDSMLEEYEEEMDLALAGIKADEVIESFDFERRKRSAIQYKTADVEKHSKAITSLNRAKNFMLEMDKLLLEE